MALLAAKAKGLHYPTPLSVVLGLSRLIRIETSGPQNKLRILDPCAGRGAAARLFAWAVSVGQTCQSQSSLPQAPQEVRAGGTDEAVKESAVRQFVLSAPHSPSPSSSSLALVAHGQSSTSPSSSATTIQPTSNPHEHEVELYTIELDLLRAQQAQALSYRALQANALSARIGEESFDILFHNPPYDDSGDLDRRLEHAFLKRFTPKLKAGGLLVHIVPRHRIGLSAEYLAHHYERVQVWAFPTEEYRVFKQVVVLGVKKRLSGPDRATHQRLKEISAGYYTPADYEAEVTRESGAPASSLLFAPGAGAGEGAGQLPQLVCPDRVSFLRVAVSEAGLRVSDYPEVIEEFERLEDARSHSASAGGRARLVKMSGGTDSGSSPTGREGASDLNNSLTVWEGAYCIPAIHFGEKEWSHEPLFRSSEYSREVALNEAATSGVWANRSLREALCPTGRSDRPLHPLVPLREGQASLMVSNGMMNNMVLTGGDGSRVLVKGRTIKRLELHSQDRTPKGQVTKEVYRERLHTEVLTLDLQSGEVKEVNLAGMGQFLDQYRASIRQLMLERYGPRYVPGSASAKADPILSKLEGGLAHLKRPALGAQAVGIVAGAYSLITQQHASFSMEMGSGKSFQGAAAAWLAGKRRVVIVCPPTLVTKWVREVKACVPGAEAEVIGKGGYDDKLTPIGLLVAAQKRIEAHEARYAHLEAGIGKDAVPFYAVVIAMTTLRDGPQWRPQVNWRRVVTGHSQGGRPLVEEIACCPRCGKRLINPRNDLPMTSQELARKKLWCDGELKSWDGKGRKWRLRPCREALWSVSARNVGTSPFASARPFSLAGSGSVGGGVGSQPQTLLADGPRKISLANYISQRMGGYFDLCILDEVHKFKGDDTAQGISAGILAEACGSVLTLTGTLAGGKASNLFKLLWRFSRKVRTAFGFEENSRWVQNYGMIEKIINYESQQQETVEDGAASDRREVKSRVVIREKAGLNPAVLEMLLEHTVFLKLSDISTGLPPYTEHVELIQMEAEQARYYEKLEEDLTDALKAALVAGSQRLLGAFVRSLLSWQDQPYHEERVIDPLSRCPGETVPTHRGKSRGTSASARASEEIEWSTSNERVVAYAPALDKETIYPKEERLIELVRGQLGQGRRVLVFVSDTEKRDITPRLKGLLEGHTPAQVAVLKSSAVNTTRREEWITKRVAEGCNVLIVHPRCVETGLDLLAFHTLVFYQIEYSTYVMRQASRRSWRIGQTRPIHVYHFVYDGTAQRTALVLMAKKIQASLMIEGDLAGSEMTDMAGEDGQGDDLLIELARKLIEVSRVEAGAEEDEASSKGSLEEAIRSLHAQEMAGDRFVVEGEYRLPDTTALTDTTTTANTTNSNQPTAKLIEALAICPVEIAEPEPHTAKAITTTPPVHNNSLFEALREQMLREKRLPRRKQGRVEVPAQAQAQGQLTMF